MGERRIAGASALAVVAMLALSGCALTGSIVDKGRLDFELTALSSALKEIPAVDDATSTVELQADYSYTIAMRVLSTAPTERDVIEILHAVDAAFSDGALSTQFTTFDLESADGPLVSQYVFGLDEDRVAADVHYFFALTEAYGAPMSMGLGEYESTDPGDYHRSIAGAASLTGANWPALRAIPDPSPSTTNSWGFLGLDTNGSIPPDKIVQVLELLAPVLPVVGEGNAWMTWEADKFSIQVSPSKNETGAFPDLALWPKVTAIAQILADSELPAATLFFSTSSMSNAGSGTVHIGECAVDAFAAERDAEFVEALAASGVVLPAGSGPGWC